MRFGLVGTGPWAQLAHGPGLLAAAGTELVGVWGRDFAKAEALASSLGTTAYAEYSELLSDVDAVAFAVPPAVQAAMAKQAALAGKHLLLDKPIASTVQDAQDLVSAIGTSGVSSVVFFTDQFVPASRDWFASVRQTGGWSGGWMRWFSALQEPGNPFGHPSWRFERGALWDTGPHALSNLTVALGPIETVSATAGAGDLVHLVLQHRSGATSAVSLTQFAPIPAICCEAAVWGEAGISMMPERPETAHSALALAAEELIASATTGEPHPIDVHFGLRIVELLDQAQRSIDSARG